MKFFIFNIRLTASHATLGSSSAHPHAGRMRSARIPSATGRPRPLACGTKQMRTGVRVFPVPVRRWNRPSLRFGRRLSARRSDCWSPVLFTCLSSALTSFTLRPGDCRRSAGSAQSPGLREEILDGATPSGVCPSRRRRRTRTAFAEHFVAFVHPEIKHHRSSQREEKERPEHKTYRSNHVTT
jgi:hypothetical protein